MNIRVISHSDINTLKLIHEKFYKHEFEFPNFFNHYLSAYVVIDDDGLIITGGGVRVITEAIAITDKDYPIKARREALMSMLQASMFTANVQGFDQLHVFIQDNKWMRHLKRVGFNNTKGQALVLNL